MGGRRQTRGRRRHAVPRERRVAARLTTHRGQAPPSKPATHTPRSAHTSRPDSLRLTRAGFSREVTGILVTLGAPFAAGLHAAGRDPGIEARQAAALVNQATAIPPLDPAHRFDRIDAALARLESLIADTGAASPPDHGLVTRLRGDRVVALRDRERWPDVVGEVAALRQEERPIPAYIRHAEADALLALRRPAEARTAYEDVLAADAQSRSARVGLFYALLEEERVSDALELVDAMASEGGPKMWRGVSPAPERNSRLARHAGARRHRPLLRRRAPRRRGGGCARSWTARRPCRSCNRRKRRLRARAGGRDSPTKRRTSRSHSPPRIETPRSHSLRRRSHESATTRPGCGPRRSSRSFRATRAWNGCAAACARTMRLSSAWTRSPAPRTTPRPRAPAPATTSDRRCWHRRSASAIASRPRTSSRRPAPSRASSGGPVMEPASKRTGPMHRWTRRFGSMREPSIVPARAWSADGRSGDHLQLEGSGARYSPDTPLRATYYGISADGAAGRVSYAWDSATIASASLRRLWFSDGNDRIEASGFLAARVVERHGLSIELRPELWWTANTRVDAPYFNPGRSTSADMIAATRHLLWRRYEQSLRHDLRLAVGAIAQEDFQPGGPGRPRTSTSLSSPRNRRCPTAIAYGRRVYDGAPGRGSPRVDQPRTPVPMTRPAHPAAHRRIAGAGRDARAGRCARSAGRKTFSRPSRCTTSWTIAQSLTRTARPRAIS